MQKKLSFIEQDCEQFLTRIQASRIIWVFENYH